MRKKYKQIDNRNKAFLGAIIGAVGAIGGAIAGAKAKKKQQQAQLEAARINAQNQQNQINANLQMQQDAVDAQYQQQLAEVEAQEKLNQEQNALTKQKVGIQSAQSLTNAFSNTNELNKEFNSRFARMGTRRKMKKCGGRTKANFGTTSLASMAKTPSIPTKINTNYGNAGTFGSLNASQKFNVIGNKIGSGLGMIGQGIQGFNTGYNLGQMFKCGGRKKAAYGVAKDMGNGNWKLDYSGRVQYHNPVVADLEVVNDQAQSYSGNTPGQNTAQYAGVNSVTTMQTAGQSPSNAVNAAITANTYQNRYGCGGKRRMKRRK